MLEISALGFSRLSRSRVFGSRNGFGVMLIAGFKIAAASICRSGLSVQLLSCGPILFG